MCTASSVEDRGKKERGSFFLLNGGGGLHVLFETKLGKEKEEKRGGEGWRKREKGREGARRERTGY